MRSAFMLDWLMRISNHAWLMTKQKIDWLKWLIDIWLPRQWYSALFAGLANCSTCLWGIYICEIIPYYHHCPHCLYCACCLHSLPSLLIKGRGYYCCSNACYSISLSTLHAVLRLIRPLTNQLFNNWLASIMLALRRHQSFITILPAQLNKRSHSALIAGIAKTVNAKPASVGYSCLPRSCHHHRGSCS
jgi:hypothetical protein